MRDSLAPTVPVADVAELLEHSDWIRKLAYVLVRNDTQADDLTQETWLAVLRSPPTPSLPVRPWLSQVVRNVLRMEYRGEKRRRVRESESHHSATSDPASLETPERLVARAQTQRMLSALVLKLDDPYRSTVLLRYFEGLSAAAIAERQGVPSGTVRWRIKKGLDQLRIELDRCHCGSRRAWQLALVPLGSEFPVPSIDLSVRVPVKGVPIMKSLLVTAALTASLTGGALLVSRNSTTPRPAAASSPTHSTPPIVENAPSVANRHIDPVQRQTLLSQIHLLQKKPGTTGHTASSEPVPTLNAEYIRTQIRALLPMIKDCYETTLRSHPDVQGKLVVDFTIVGEPDVGALVSDSAINDSQSTIADADMRECVKETMYSASFPAPPAGGEMHVTYPFLFAPSETP